MKSLQPKVAASTSLSDLVSRDRLAELYAKYALFVAGFATRLLSRQDEVEDVVQEVFLIAAKQLDNLKDPPKVRGWLKVVTLRRAGHFLRWKRVRARFGISPATSDEQILVSPAASPEDRAALREFLVVLEKMPVDLRIAWSLRRMHGETVESIADLTGCSLSTAKRRIAAAQRFIDQEFSDG